MNEIALYLFPFLAFFGFLAILGGCFAFIRKGFDLVYSLLSPKKSRKD